VRLIKFYTPEMGAVGETRWFDAGEPMPALDWSKVLSVDVCETMTFDQFRSKFPEVSLDI
jgi:hypothetical protein